MRTGWPSASLDEACAHTRTIDPTKHPDEVFTYVDVSSVSNRTFEIEQVNQILGRDAPSRARKQIEEGDVIFATVRPTLMRLARVPPELNGQVCSTGYVVLRPKDHLDGQFLYYSLLRPEFLEAMQSLQSGASYPAVTDRQVFQQHIPLPPVEEQKRIVAVLDQAFAALDRARVHAEANLADASALFGASLAEAFYSEGDIPTQALASICKFEGGSQPPKSQFVDSPRKGYIRLLQIRDFKSDEKAVYILDDGKRRRCTADDIMIGRYGASVGQIHRGKAGTYNVALIKTIPNADLLVRDYFYYYLVSDLFQKPLLSRSSRGAQDGFNKEDIAPFLVPVPTLETQEFLVRKLSSIEADAKRLITQYEQKLADLATLRQSLLQKAFSGELT